MTERDATELPNLAEVLARVVARVPREQQPLLVAIAERMAAERYRDWAAQPGYEGHRGRLLACAQREEEIAGRIEALYENAAAVRGEILAKAPDLGEINRSLFAGRPLAQQLILQAQGERLGAATWRAFAADAAGPSAEVFGACALLEEESAVVLEDIVKVERQRSERRHEE
jgi:hypothetical protein